MNRLSGEEKSVSQQASYWLDAANNGEDLRGFREWIRTSPEHAREFASFAMMRSLVRELNPVQDQRLKRLIRISGEPANVATLAERAGRRLVQQEPRRRRWLPRLRHTIAAAVLAAFAALASPSVYHYFYWTEYSTIDSVARTVALPDGSMLHLGPRSRVEVHISGSVRLARFHEGEALFKIQKQPDSRFRVEVDGGEIDVLGTQFRVRRERNQNTIHVIKGTIQITGSAHEGQAGEPVALMAGQSARLRFDGQIQRGTGSAVAGVVEPRVFHEWPLPEVAEFFNRRNPTPQLIVEPGAKGELFSAILAPDDTQGLIDILQHTQDLEVLEEGNIVRIRRRTEESATD